MVDTLGWITQVELVFRIGVFGISLLIVWEPGLERASCAASLGLSTSDAPRPRTDVAFCRLTRSHACPKEQAGATRRSPKRLAAAHRAGWHHSGRARWFGRGLRCTSMRRRVAVTSRGIGTHITDIRTSSASNATAPNHSTAAHNPKPGGRIGAYSSWAVPGFPDTDVAPLSRTRVLEVGLLA
jgi:hypothetical protein